MTLTKAFRRSRTLRNKANKLVRKDRLLKKEVRERTTLSIFIKYYLVRSNEQL